MTQVTEQPKRRTGLVIWLIISQLLAVASLWLWIVVAGSIAMGFDTGDARTTWITLISVCAYPLFPLIMAFGAWVAFVLHKNRLAAVLTGLTIVPPIVLIVVLLLQSI
jgi:hypothetical protein